MHTLIQAFIILLHLNKGVETMFYSNIHTTGKITFYN